MSSGSWFRSIGDDYAKIALSLTKPLAKEANAAEAAKYYGIADRLDRTDITPEKED